MPNVVRNVWAISQLNGTHMTMLPTIYLTKPEASELRPGQELMEFENAFSAKAFIVAFVSKHTPIKVAA